MVINLFLGACLLGGALLNGNIWVQLQHCLDVLQWVLLHCNTLAAGTAWAEGGLDFISLNGKRLEAVLIDYRQS